MLHITFLARHVGPEVLYVGLGCDPSRFLGHRVSSAIRNKLRDGYSHSLTIAYVSCTASTPIPQFRDVANALRDEFLFGLITDKAAIEAAGVTPPAIVIYRNFDEPKTAYPYPISSLTAYNLTEWMNELTIPILGPIDGDSYMKYDENRKPLAYFFTGASSDDADAQIAAIRPIATKYRSEMNFVWLNGLKYANLGKRIGLSEAKWPDFTIVEVKNYVNYPFPQSEEFTASRVESWVEQYLIANPTPPPPPEPKGLFSAVEEYVRDIAPHLRNRFRAILGWILDL